jgi:hypothetical protein
LSKLDKVPSQSEVYPVSECVRSYFCSLMDGADPMVSRSVFSSLSILKLGSQELFPNESERPIKIVGRLDMLSQKECAEIIQETFNEHGIGVLMSNDQKVPESQKAKRFDDSIYRIYILSGGHPRTLDTLLRAILDYRAFNIARGRNPTMSDLLAFIGSNDFIEKESLSESNFECVRSVLIGDQVRYNEIIPGLSTSFDEAAKRGDLIGSNDSIKYTPYLPIINLWRWAMDITLSSQYGLIAFQLCRMMEVGMNFNPLLFEQFCYRREVILSFIRQSIAVKYQSIMLQDIYSKGIKPDVRVRSGAFSTHVDASLVLDIINYDELSEIEHIKAGIFVPSDPRNAGFDYIVRYPVVSGNDYIDVYFQIKYSDKDVTTKINNDDISSNLKHCNIASNGKAFVFVMYGWREKAGRIRVPGNCIIYDREALALEFGPTLAQFLSVQELSPTRYGSNSVSSFSSSLSSSSSSSSSTSSFSFDSL